jgi:glycosyltransferase involved in cell wall biosynthesis
MVDGLTAAGADVSVLGPLHAPLERPLRVASAVRNRLRPDRYGPYYEAPMTRAFSRQVAAGLVRSRPDVVVASTFLPLTDLDTDVPLVVWNDATIGGLIGYYDDYTRWSPRMRRLGRTLEGRTLQRLHLFAAASGWAAGTALRDYALAPERVAVLPFGANLDAPPAVPDRAPRPGRPVRLLTVGVEWERKGIDLAIDATAELARSGLDVRLDVVGCTPPTGAVLPPQVSLVGHVDAAAPAGRRRLAELYAAADVFLLPTRAECFGVVFCEAAAHGLPVVSTDTGGVGTAVAAGRTGLLLPEGSGAGAYAAAVRRLVEEPGLYERLAAGARRRFEEELTWERAARRLLDRVEALPPVRARAGRAS